MSEQNGNWLQELLAEHQPPCVSIYLPTGRAQPPAHQDPVRYGDHIRTAEEEMLRLYPRTKIEPILQKLRALAEDNTFWAGGDRDGVGVFASADFMQVVNLDQTVTDHVVVADSFHVKPLIRLIQSGDRYQVLCLALKDVKLFEGSRYRLTPLELRDVPSDVAAVAGMTLSHQTDAHIDLAQASRQQDEGKASGMGTPSVETFMRAVDRAVWEHYSRPQKLPLILCAVEEWHPLFHAISKNPYLMKEGIKLSPVHLPLERLKEEAWRIMEPIYREKLDRLSNDFKAARAHHQASDEVIEVAAAASTGRVGTLLVQDNVQIPGRIQRHSGQIVPIDPRLEAPHVDDLLDDLAEMVLRTDGQVLVLPQDQMPTDTGIAAIYRY